MQSRTSEGLRDLSYLFLPVYLCIYVRLAKVNAIKILYLETAINRYYV